MAYLRLNLILNINVHKQELEILEKATMRQESNTINNKSHDKLHNFMHTLIQWQLKILADRVCVWPEYQL